MGSHVEQVAEGAKATASGCVMGNPGKQARMEAFKKLTPPERKLVYARNTAVAHFLMDSYAETRRLLEEDPFRTDYDRSSTPEWRAELARILDAYPLPDAMEQAGDYMRRFTLPM